MAVIEEPLKGVSVFLVVTLLVYFAYDNIISGILTWTTSYSSLLGAMGWVGFILLYLVCAPLYMFYTFIAGGKGETTRAGYVLAGFSSFFFFLIVATFINILFAGVGGNAGLIDSLSATATTISGENLDALDQISWLAVFVAVIGCIGAPLGLILHGYGQLDSMKEVVQSA